METPNDIDYAIYEAKLDGLSDMYLAAVDAYRKGIIESLCRFVREFAPSSVHAVRLAADVDWRWGFDAFVDKDGQEVDYEFGENFYFEDLFSPSYLSELFDFHKSSYGFVYVADREFSDLRPAAYAEHKRLLQEIAKGEQA